MAIDAEIGPIVTIGNAIYPTNANGTPVNNIEEIDPEAGPNLSYQGDGILDPRFFVSKDSALGRPGSLTSQLNSPYLLSCDNVPSQLGTAKIAAAQAAANGTPLTLVSAASAGISTNVPFYPFKSSVLTLAPIALDFGFMAAATNAANDTLSVNGTVTATASSLLAASNFYPGQYLVLPNAASSTQTLITYVVSVSGTTVTLANAPAVTTTTQMVGSANIPQVGWTGNPVANAARPYLAGGIGAFLNPKESITRAVSVTANAGATGGVVQISGWDIYGQPQTENITAAAATTVSGKKTWKYIQSATPQFTDAGHTYSVGTIDTFGFAFRSDRWEYTNIFWAGSFIATSTGWTAGDLTSPTTTTGDVRGTYAAVSASDGVKRLALFMSMPLYNVIAATPAAPQPMYGNFPV